MIRMCGGLSPGTFVEVDSFMTKNVDLMFQFFSSKNKGNCGKINDDVGQIVGHVEKSREML